MSAQSASTAPAAAPEHSFTLAGTFPPRKVPAVYRLALAASAFAMVLLPLVYVAIIAATGYGVYLYAIVGTTVFENGGRGLWPILAYVGPLVAGGIVIVFMIKPLFARPVRGGEPPSLDLEAEPRLRDFIATLCARIGAPMPVRVDVDCQVNASARFRRGLLSLGRRDLVLTIGLPLAGGLTARQFAGVLAHEFGHFAQGAGMAFTYVIRSVNNWFGRVVFERDSWDIALAEWSQRLDIRLGAIFWISRGAIWLSRRILHGLMYVGHAITCFQLRQMEFDADYYEAQVAGSNAFAETSRELRRLGFTSQAAFNELGGLWRDRRLVDDFPGFIVLRRSQLKPDVQAKLHAAQNEAKTRWSDTHPSDADRMVHAANLRLSGIFQGEGPASVLFTDFSALSREVTRRFYREHLELSFDDNALVPAASAARNGDEVAAAEEALKRLTGSVLNLARPLVWTRQDFTPATTPLTPESIAAAFAADRVAIQQALAGAQAAEKIFGTLSEERSRVEIAHAFLSHKIKIKAEVFGLSRPDLAEVERRRIELSSRLAAKTSELSPYETAVHGWVKTVVRTARTPVVATQLPEPLVERILRLAETLAALAPWLRAFPGWLHQQRVIEAFAANEHDLHDNRDFNAALAGLRDQARTMIKNAPALIGDVGYPFPHAGGPATAAQVLERALDGVHGDGRLIVLLETVASLYFRLLAQLAHAGEEVEQALTAAASPDLSQRPRERNVAPATLYSARRDPSASCRVRPVL